MKPTLEHVQKHLKGRTFSSRSFRSLGSAVSVCHESATQQQLCDCVDRSTHDVAAHSGSDQLHQALTADVLTKLRAAARRAGVLPLMPSCREAQACSSLQHDSQSVLGQDTRKLASSGLGFKMHVGCTVTKGSLYHSRAAQYQTQTVAV